jgi:hypothetical protein
MNPHILQLLRLFKQRQDTLDARIASLESEEMREQAQESDFSAQLDTLLLEIENGVNLPTV